MKARMAVMAGKEKKLDFPSRFLFVEVSDVVPVAQDPNIDFTVLGMVT
jgi:hypothetical protein